MRRPCNPSCSKFSRQSAKIRSKVNFLLWFTHVYSIYKYHLNFNIFQHISTTYFENCLHSSCFADLCVVLCRRLTGLGSLSGRIDQSLGRSTQSSKGKPRGSNSVQLSTQFSAESYLIYLILFELYWTKLRVELHCKPFTVGETMWNRSGVSWLKILKVIWV